MATVREKRNHNRPPPIYIITLPLSQFETMKSAIRISALLWAELILYALFEMQDYLTDVWGLSFTHAAGILNIWVGISKVLQPLFLFLAGKFLGNFRMLVVSSSAHTIGMLFLFMSTPPVLANSTGTCKQYRQECIGESQKALLYTGMALIAVGQAGNSISLKSFLCEQQEKSGNQVAEAYKTASLLMLILVGLAGVILLPSLPCIKPWAYRFGIPAIFTAVATISFLTGLCCDQYNMPGPEGCQISNFRMLTLRMWSTSIVCGIVCSIGNTYFVEQAKHLDRHLGKWNVPAQVLLVAQIWLGKLLAGWFLTRPGPAYGVVMAKAFSVLCCITAAIMEVKRLGVVRRHGLLDRPDEDVPMSVYWLLFQFVLLGGMVTLLDENVEDESHETINEQEKHALCILTNGVTGIGYMCGALLVYVVGRVSGEGDKPSWFRFTLNRSRLDLYYWLLAVLSSVSLVVSVVVRVRNIRYTTT